MGIDSGRRNTAVRMLRKATPMTVVRVTQTGYDTTTRKANLVEVDIPVHGKISNYSLKDVGKGGIEAGDLKVTIAAKELGDVAPSQGDKAVWGGVTYMVKNCDSVYGLREPVMYILQVRK